MADSTILARFRRRHRRICRDIIVGVTEVIGNIEHEPRIDDQEACRAEDVLDGRIGENGT